MISMTVANMMINNIYIIIVALGLLTLFLTKFLIAFSKKRHLLSYPNERSLHSTPTPRIGGVAFVATWYIGLLLFFYLGLVESELFFALLSGLLLAMVSLIDDLVGIKPVVRLIVHFVVVVGAFWLLGGIRPLISFNYGEIIHYCIIYPLSVVGMVWFINLFNFMDGIDGYASIEAISIALILFIFSCNPLLLLLFAVVLGFLFWNWPKAKIFMGDIGSTQLGFILIVFGIHFHNKLDFSILNWIMLASPFWFDATYTLYRRWRNREKLSQAHKKHAFQRLVQAGYSHLQVDIGLIVINLIILLLILMYREFFSGLQLPIVVLCVFAMYIITRKVDKLVPFK